MGDVNATRMFAALKVPKTVPIIMGSPSGSVHDGYRYMDDGARRRIEFVRDITGGAPVVRAIIDLTTNGPSGTVMCFSSTSTSVGATGAAAALPAQPLGYLISRTDAGVAIRIPYYN